MKIAINTEYGGFCLSERAVDLYHQYAAGGTTIGERTRARTDPILVRVVEELGREASGGFSDIKVIEVPDGVDWMLQEYDGMEFVMGMMMCRRQAEQGYIPTEDERAHLLLLGTTAGAPSIMMEAVQSGNIFDPQHMEKAEAMKAEWQRGIEILREFTSSSRFKEGHEGGKAK